jgi:hypothetical protein
MSNQRETLAARSHRLRLNANALQETSRDLIEEAREMIAASRQMRDEAAAKRATSWRRPLG